MQLKEGKEERGIDYVPDEDYLSLLLYGLSLIGFSKNSLKKSNYQNPTKCNFLHHFIMLYKVIYYSISTTFFLLRNIK